MIPDVLWRSYLTAAVRLELADETVDLHPADTRGRWPGGPDRYVLTAWNPGSVPADPATNAAAQRRLEADLRAAGATVRASSGRSVDPQEPWAEDGCVADGLDEAAVLALGRAYGQLAVYGWTSAAWAVLACDGSRRTALGWRLADPAA